MLELEISYYTQESKKITVPKKIIMLSDLHNVEYEHIVDAVLDEKPDIITVVGDVVDRHRKTYSRALGFLESLSIIAPTFFSFGNHEVKFDVLSEDDIENTGAVLLDNSYVKYGEMVIGGHTPSKDFSWVDDFERREEFKLLLCHQPEHYKKYLRYRNIDLTLSGHAHGGQWRPFGIPIFAPGQGLFPPYTSGFYEGKLVVGRGLSDVRAIPRLFNPIEIVVIEVEPKKDDARDFTRHYNR
ncbi:MAG: hypothetical protein GX269_00930 [Clostridiales bacterium]|nr:hypothetical protein [Clostridiales bacterium]